MTTPPSVCPEIFARCVQGISTPILSRSKLDKEFSFQNWFKNRIEGIDFTTLGRNKFPDLVMVNTPEGFELKGITYGTRSGGADSNSTPPRGIHNGRTIFYVFGRYPKEAEPVIIEPDELRLKKPIIDLLICHGDFLNASNEYVHKNRSFRGFGSYGDILIRDRKMYVPPSPFTLLNGVDRLATLILPSSFPIDKSKFTPVGNVEREESQEMIVSYGFDLITNDVKIDKVVNPSAGKMHKFTAYRLSTQDHTPVSLVPPAIAAIELSGEDEENIEEGGEG